VVITAQDVYEAFNRSWPGIDTTPFYALSTEHLRRFEAVAIELSAKAGAIYINEQHAYDEGWEACERSQNEASREEAERAQHKLDQLRALEKEVEAKLGLNLDREVEKLEAVL
jgi:hypothetical protein